MSHEPARRSVELLIGSLDLEGFGEAHAHAVRTELADALVRALGGRPLPWWASRRLAELHVTLDGGLSPGGLVEALCDRICEALVEARPEALLRRRAAAEARAGGPQPDAVKRSPADA